MEIKTNFKQTGSSMSGRPPSNSPVWIPGGWPRLRDVSRWKPNTLRLCASPLPEHNPPREDASSPAPRRITETLSMNALLTYTTFGSGGRMVIEAGGPRGTSSASNMICLADVLAYGTEGVPRHVPFDAQAVEL